MSYQRAVNGFGNPKSNFTVSKDKNGKYYISGIIVFCGIPMEFSLHEQLAGCRFALRGRIVVLSPGKGKVLKMRECMFEKKFAERQKKKKRRVREIENSPALTDNIDLSLTSVTMEISENDPQLKVSAEARNIKRDLYSNAINNGVPDNDKIKAEILLAAEDLFNEYKSDIQLALKKIDSYMKNNSAEMSLVHLDDFMKKKYANLKSFEKIRRSIERVTDYLSYDSMGNVTNAMLKDYVESHSSTAAKDLRYACEFWRYCQEKKVYSGINPLEVFIDKSRPKKPKRDSDAEIKKANTFDTIPTEIERRLNDLILSDINDSLNLGLLLIKELGKNVPDVLMLRWKNFSFDENNEYVVIDDHKNDISGATHDYSHPISPFASKALRERRRILLKTVNEAQLNELYVVHGSKNGNNPFARKKLNDFCRNILDREDIDLSSFAPAPGEPNGAGVRMLIRNFENRLLYHCGMEQDPSAVDFLMERSLSGNVTADNYRSFTDKQAQHNLYTYQKRDTRFAITPSVDGDGISVVVNADGTKTYTISPLSPHKLTGTRLIFLGKPGDLISVSAPHGSLIACNVSTTKKKKDL